MKEKIAITAIASISPLGNSLGEVWENYQSDDHCFSQQSFNGEKAWAACLPEHLKSKVDALRKSDTKYKKLDDSVLFAIHSARNAIRTAGWKPADNFGINIGSSRGATSLFEKYHKEFLQEKKTTTLASPTTTLGNISSWVAHDLQTQGPEISHSITCSTALHSVLNGIAWLQSGMADKFLVGGSEAPLTPFTIAQMQALKIYAQNRQSGSYPCQALDLQKTENTMILGEGAAMACLEIGAVPNALAMIIGLGYATEPLVHNVSISTDALCFQRSIAMALGGVLPEEVDVIVLHAPGTIKGDQTEYRAIKKIFSSKTPFLTTNKWKIGHTFGASGMLNIELAVLMLQHQKAIPVPFIKKQYLPKRIHKVLVNAVGFGGNAVSILLESPV
ncbi:beta-ketoacyl synthase N-terminal-like domain-containing protein [Maribacter antarcticus]|uniref:beta-ketoacyl synthase N-terminal-like domain-containing protein n=1 Tax=Maribacter antarcticus TaxID=505250 RepID=UPI00047D3A4E|nr:beta-ketoacyl synthase N-terminal-like domain-containing protein [Maribacter antarcticus]